MQQLLAAASGTDSPSIPSDIFFNVKHRVSLLKIEELF